MYMLLFQVADDNYRALLSFFAKFPNFTQNDFFIFGESYGGIYVPTLSLRVFTGTAKINFKVIFFSPACTLVQVVPNPLSTPEFMALFKHLTFVWHLFTNDRVGQVKYGSQKIFCEPRC